MADYISPITPAVLSDGLRADAQSALFSRLNNGSIAGQQGFSLSGGATAVVAGPNVNVAAYFANQADYVLSPREFSTGVIRFQAMAGTNGNFMFVWGLPSTGLPAGSFAVWAGGANTTGGNIEFGWIAHSPNVAVTSVAVGVGAVPTGRYTVEITHRGQTAGSVTEIRAWADGANRPTAPTFSYTFTGSEPVAATGTRIGLRTIATNTVSFANLEVFDNATIIRTQALPSGYWFPLVSGGVTTLATINQGSRLDMSVQGSLNFTLNVIGTSAAAYQPKVAFKIDNGPIFYRTVPGAGPQALTFVLPDTKLHRVAVIASGIHEADTVWTSGTGLLVSGFTVDAGAQVRRLSDDRSVLSVFGDSITAGIVANGYAATGPVSQPSQSAAEVGYAQVVAQRLNYRVIQHGFGGTGVTVSGSGGVPKATVNVFNYQSTMPLFGEDAPNVILINEGTNDGAQVAATVQADYLALIDALTARYPGVRIVLMRPLNGNMAPVVQIAAGLRNLQYIDTSTWAGVTFTDGTHPDVAGHNRVAELLVPSLLGIQPAPIFSGFSKSLPVLKANLTPAATAGGGAIATITDPLTGKSNIVYCNGANWLYMDGTTAV